MRVLLALVLAVFGSAGVTAARAADLSVEHSGGYAPRFGFVENGERAGMLLIYDNQPGVLVRAYWSAPWRHHHYFPATGRMPAVGRDEHLSVLSPPPRPAKTFKRSWSNAAALERASEHEQPIYLLPPDVRPSPRMGLQPSNPKP
ncbi:MAG: hypothetical protein ACRECA_09245 [Pseudolabrys sp.]